MNTSVWGSCRYLRFSRYQIESLILLSPYVPGYSHSISEWHLSPPMWPSSKSVCHFGLLPLLHIQGHLLTRSLSIPPPKSLQYLPSCPSFTASWVHLTILVSSCLDYFNSPTNGLHSVVRSPSPSRDQIGSTGRLSEFNYRLYLLQHWAGSLTSLHLLGCKRETITPSTSRE